MAAHISKLLRRRVREPEAKSQSDLVQRMRTDYQVSLAEKVLAAEVKAVDVQVTARDSSAAWLAKHVERLWKTHLPKMLDCIADGRVAFEKDWSYRNGKNFINALIDMPVEQTEMLLNDDGDFAGIKVRLSEHRSDTIPPAGSWWLALDATAKHPHGTSRFQGAPYETWRERREAINLRRLLVSKFAIQGIIGRAPRTVEIENGQVIDGISAFLQACDELQSGGSMCLPNDVDPVSGKPSHEIVQFPQVNSPGEIDTHIDGLDQEQLQAFGIPPKTVLEGESGSYAMVVAQRRVLDAVVDDILSQIETSFNESVADPLCEANGYAKGTVAAQHEPLISSANQLLYDIMTALIANEDVATELLVGVIDVEQVLSRLKVPMAPDAKARLQKLIDRIKAKPEPAKPAAEDKGNPPVKQNPANPS